MKFSAIFCFSRIYDAFENLRWFFDYRLVLFFLCSIGPYFKFLHIIIHNTFKLGSSSFGCVYYKVYVIIGCNNKQHEIKRKTYYAKLADNSLSLPIRSVHCVLHHLCNLPALFLIRSSCSHCVCHTNHIDIWTCSIQMAISSVKRYILINAGLISLCTPQLREVLLKRSIFDIYRDQVYYPYFTKIIEAFVKGAISKPHPDKLN